MHDVPIQQIPDAELSNRLDAVRTRIRAAALSNGREPGTITLLAVSKTRTAQDIARAVGLGQTRFGENYAQEGVAKIQALRAMTLPAPIEWHFIGPIQSNKTKLIAEHFDWVQSIDRQSIAERLSRQRPSALGRLNALIEVNLDGEASKSGVAPEGVASMAADIVSLPGLKLRGVMAIPQPSTDPIAQRERFDRLKSLADTLACLAPDIDTISMGMSGDYESAIAAGSTMVRIGTAIFGERS